MVMFDPLDDLRRAEADATLAARLGTTAYMEPRGDIEPSIIRGEGLSGVRQRRRDGVYQHCNACREVLSPDQFDGRDKVRCRACEAVAAEGRAIEQQAARKVGSLASAFTPRQRLIAARCETYHLMVDEYERIEAAQDHRCAICERKPRADRPLYVDHDHRTGRVRGLLCVSCNTGLGKLRDDLVTLHRAVDYLSAPPAVQLGIIGYGKREQGYA